LRGTFTGGKKDLNIMKGGKGGEFKKEMTIVAKERGKKEIKNDRGGAFITKEGREIWTKPEGSKERKKK